MIEKIEIESTRLKRLELLIDGILVVITPPPSHAPESHRHAVNQRNVRNDVADACNCHVGKRYRVNTPRHGGRQQERSDCVRQCLQHLKNGNGSPGTLAAMARAYAVWRDVAEWED